MDGQHHSTDNGTAVAVFSGITLVSKPQQRVRRSRAFSPTVAFQHGTPAALLQEGKARNRGRSKNPSCQLSRISRAPTAYTVLPPSPAI